VELWVFVKKKKKKCGLVQQICIPSCNHSHLFGHGRLWNHIRNHKLKAYFPKFLQAILWNHKDPHLAICVLQVWLRHIAILTLPWTNGQETTWARRALSGMVVLSDLLYSARRSLLYGAPRWSLRTRRTWPKKITSWVVVKFVDVAPQVISKTAPVRRRVKMSEIHL
jgi:hypothetical protein